MTREQEINQAAVLFAFYGDMGNDEREPRTTSRLQMELLKDGDRFYVDKIEYAADGPSWYDPATKSSCVKSTTGKVFTDSDFPFTNIIRKK